MSDDTQMTASAGCAYTVAILVVAIASPLVWLGLFILALIYRFATGDQVEALHNGR